MNDLSQLSPIETKVTSNHPKQLKAASVFHYYVEDQHHLDTNDQLQNDEKKKKKCPRKCCFRRRKWCRWAKKRPVGSKDLGRKSDLSGESGEEIFTEDEEEQPPNGCCWGIFRGRSSRKSARRREEEEWHEDMGKVEHVTPGFNDWLTHTFRKDKKDSAKIRTARMKARRNWTKAVVSQETGSIVSFKGLPESAVRAITDLLQDIAVWEFDMFELDELTNHRSLSFVVQEIFKVHDFMRKFRISTLVLKNFLKAVEAGYMMHGNPYHNQRHAADVTQTVHSILTSHPILSHKFTDLELFGLIFAAVIHDLAHPGTTNNFHVNAQTHLALLYNDRNILENHHVSSAFQILKNNSCNILENLTKGEYKEFRELVIELVLGTDMVNHFHHIKTLRGYVKQRDWNGTSHKTISTTLALILHAADIANPAKPWSLHKACTELVYAEYLAQGIQEKKMNIPVSPLCDPKDQNAATQITFIEVIVQPTFQVMADVFDLIISSELPEDSSLSVSQKRLSARTYTELKHPSSTTIRKPRQSMAARFGSFIAAGIGRNSRLVEDNVNRPWLSYLALNLAHWRKIKDAETQAHRRKTLVSQVDPEQSTLSENQPFLQLHKTPHKSHLP